MRGLRAIGCGCLVALLVWLFLDVLWFDHRLAFRDAAHFYGPLFRLVHAEWAAGRIPWWNPYADIGVPLAASPTASVFYPGQLLALLPLPPGQFEIAYVIAHLLLAAGATYVLARDLGCSAGAAVLACLAYAFSGSVVFQYCNVVFLVGAAWLPAALWAMRGMVHQGQPRYALLLGAAMALMTLGGDPQMTYHTALFVAVYFAVQWISGRQTKSLHSNATNTTRFKTIRTLALFALAAGTAIVLSAVQLVPAMELTRLSTRGMSAQPRNVYQLASHWLEDSHQEIASPTATNMDEERRTAGTQGNASDDQPQRPSTYAALLAKTDHCDSHLRHTYLFSLGPWHLPELWIPNFSGQMFPTNQRWIRAFADEHWTWVPSLYMGLIPAVLALACWGHGADRQVRRLRWFTLFCFLAACGQYGPGWIVRESAALIDAQAGNLSIGDGFGGVYWLMANLLPGYETFRFPAKWLVPTSLGIALLAAKGWDRGDLAYWLRVRRISIAPLLVAAVMGVAVFTAGMRFPQYTPKAPVDVVFGPLDVPGSWRAFLISCFQAGVVSLILVWITTRILRQTENKPEVQAASGQYSPASRYAILIVAVTAIDLALAQKPLIATAPSAAWQLGSPVVEAIQREESTNATEVPPRVDRESLLRTTSWRNEIDPDRMTQIVERDRATLRALYQIDFQMALAPMQGTMQLADFEAFYDSAAAITHRQQTIQAIQPGTGLDSLSIHYLLTPQGFVSRRPTAVTTEAATELHSSDVPQDENVLVEIPLNDLEGVALWRSSHPAPRTWIAHEWETLPPLGARSMNELNQRTAVVLENSGLPRDLHSRPVVESQATLSSPSPAPTSEQLAAESSHIVHYDPGRVVLEVEMAAEGIVILADQFYPGWQARVTSSKDGPPKPVEVFRVNRVLRGVWLPKGKHRVEFTYAPTRLLVAAGVSGLGWIALFGLACFATLRRKKASA